MSHFELSWNHLISTPMTPLVQNSLSQKATYFFQIVRFRKMLAQRPFAACIASIRTSNRASLQWFDGVKLSVTMIRLTTSIITRWRVLHRAQLSAHGRHLERSCVRCHAELRQSWCRRKSNSTVRRQVRRRRPLWRCQSAGRRLMAAWRTREWCCDLVGSEPNRRIRVVLIREITQVDRCCVRLTSSSSLVASTVYMEYTENGAADQSTCLHNGEEGKKGKENAKI